MCDGLLQGAGHDWHRIDGFDVEEIPADVLSTQRAAFAEILTDLNSHRPWVLKEPRLCLLLPALEPLLDDVVCIIVSRDPVEVARSVHHRNHLPMAGAIALWEAYTLAALEASAQHRRVHIRHEDLLADPVGALGRLLDDLTGLGVTGLSVPAPEVVTDFITPSLHRQRSDPTARRDQLNASQLDLAELLDRQPLPEHLPPMSAGGIDAIGDLASFDDETTARRDAQSEVRRLDATNRRLVAETQRLERAAERLESAAERQDAALQHERGRRTDLARISIEALDRAERDIRAMTRGRTAQAAAYTVALRRTLTPGLSRTDPTPFSRALAGIEQGRRRIRGSAGLPEGAGTTQVGSRSDAPNLSAADLIRRTRPKTEPTGRPKVAVLSWDVGHNPLGRANVLAEVLSRRFEVELWGAQFDRYGSRLWAPLRDIDTPVNVFPGLSFPQHLAVMEEVAGSIDADAIWVSKPRLPSLLLGALAKEARNRPLILDVDDHELAFFDTDETLDISSLLERKGDPALALPFERDWTRACEPLISGADLVTVSNVALQARFGGTVVPHARDENVFDPESVDREAVRRRLGIGPDERVLIFGGTPRLHKGVGEVLQALETLGDRRYRLIVFGTREFDELRPQLGDLVRWLLPLPYQPFSAIPEVVAAADLACIVQQPDHPVSRYQLPAKLTDALAMGVPVLLRATPPLQPFIDNGAVAAVGDGQDLADAIAAVFDDPSSTASRVAKGRQLFLDTMSYDAVGRQVAPLFSDLMGEPPPLSPQMEALIEVPRRLYDGSGGLAGHVTTPQVPARRPGVDSRPIPPGEPFDVVVFWKQNDTGIYGRRQEMFVDQLVKSPRVHKVVHFDNPITPEQLQRLWRDADSPSHQGRLVVRSTLARVARRSDRPGLASRTWIYGGSRTRRLGFPPRREHLDHVTGVLEREGVGERPWILWTYPTNNDLPALIDNLNPDMVLTDLVDDNRTWYAPGTPEHDRLDQNYQDVLSRSDLVLANCAPVAASLADYASEIHVIPNGLELDPPESIRCPELDRLNGPVIGYVGNLSSRIDIGLLDELLLRRPRWQFVFIGSTHLDPTILRLDAHPNAHFLGVRPHREARALMARFDVALIPHVDNEMTQAMNPLKAFVYTGVGVPVVSTPIANLGELDGIVTIAEGVDGFIEAIEHHLAAGHQPLGHSQLVPHSWQARLAKILELIDSYPIREPGSDR